MIGRQVINTDYPWYTRRFLRNLLGQATRAITQSQHAARSPIEEAALFVADTRPAMFFGVPHILAVFLIALFGESIVFVGPIYALWVIIPWCAARVAVRRDYNMPRIFVLWLMTKAGAFDARSWYGASPSPFPIQPGNYPRGIWQ